MITRKEFKDITGEYPEDVLGSDWQDFIAEWNEETEMIPFNQLNADLEDYLTDI
jgi:hypothetical protein